MSTLTSHNGLQVVTPDPTGAGGLAINNNFIALSTPLETTDPSSSNNSSEGYSIGSRWYNTATGVEWICTDATGAAVWVAVVGGLSVTPGATGTASGGNAGGAGGTFANPVVQLLGGNGGNAGTGVAGTAGGGADGPLIQIQPGNSGNAAGSVAGDAGIIDTYGTPDQGAIVQIQTGAGGSSASGGGIGRSGGNIVRGSAGSSNGGRLFRINTGVGGNGQSNITAATPGA